MFASRKLYFNIEQQQRTPGCTKECTARPSGRPRASASPASSTKGGATRGGGGATGGGSGASSFVLPCSGGWQCGESS